MVTVKNPLTVPLVLHLSLNLFTTNSYPKSANGSEVAYQGFGDLLLELKLTTSTSKRSCVNGKFCTKSCRTLTWSSIRSAHGVRALTEWRVNLVSRRYSMLGVSVFGGKSNQGSKRTLRNGMEMGRCQDNIQHAVAKPKSCD